MDRWFILRNAKRHQREMDAVVVRRSAPNALDSIALPVVCRNTRKTAHLKVDTHDRHQRVDLRPSLTKRAGRDHLYCGRPI